jgi:acyl-CoA thioester hydrolase
MTDSTSSLPFRLTERVRWADVDLVRIMRFSAVTRFVELAEQEFMREIGLPYGDAFQSPMYWLPRRHLAIDYLAPAFIDDALTMLVWVSRIGESSFSLHVDLQHADGRTVARATLVIVCVSASHFAKQPVPAELRERLTPFVMTAPPTGWPVWS